jgi:hypothetical protein
LTNPSAFHPLRIFSQERSRKVTVSAPTAAPLPKRETREELIARGSKIVMVPSTGTVREGAVLKTVTREIPTPLHRTLGYEDLNQFVTEISERQLREQQAAAAAAAMLASNGGPRVQHIVDEWGATHPLQSVPPGAKNVSVPLSEEKRLVIECDEEVALQIQNESTTRTLRLRTRDATTGATSHVAFAAPAQVALVVANPKSAAVLELMPS